MAPLSTAVQAFLGLTSLRCTPETFNHPELFGAKFTHIEANVVWDVSAYLPQGEYTSHHAMTVDDVSFCNVSIHYTHPGWNDNINTQVWLPIEDWNGRLQGSGGGGFQTGIMDSAMLGAVGQGFAVVSTDGGHIKDVSNMDWVLSSPGNINWGLVQDFASVSLNDAAVIGKAITKDFYGRAPRKSYWNGCSMGGRQGMMLAQRYPDAYDGILAAAPAIHVPEFMTAGYWPSMVMQEAGEVPAPCEFNAITKAATDACDELDGVRDRIVSAPQLCNFDARSMIGKEIYCPDIHDTIRISETAANVIGEAWTGPRAPDGSFLWHGLNFDTPLTDWQGLAYTTCDDAGHCRLSPIPLPANWIKNFMLRDADADIQPMNRSELSELFHKGHEQFKSVLSADDPDLGSFARKGGKLLHWHGLADQAIMTNGSREYWHAVTKFDPDSRDYYRYFEVPGVGHCFGGPGPYPGFAFEQLMEWVEGGEAPDRLFAVSVTNEVGDFLERDLCAYPKSAWYKGRGDARIKSSFTCL